MEISDDLLSGQLAPFRKQFADSLDARLAEIDAASRILAKTPDGEARHKALVEIGAFAHKLAGIAGSLAFWHVYGAGRDLESLCQRAAKGSVETVAEIAGRVAAKAGSLAAAARKDLEAFAGEPDGGRQLSVDQAGAPHQHDAVQTIVLLEDDGDQANVLKIQLSNFGFQVHAVSDYAQLIAAISATEPVAVLMDIVIGADASAGLRMFEQLKRDRDVDCPVIFVSVRDDFEARLDAVRGGADGYMVKPVDVVDLAETITRITQARQAKERYRVLVIDSDGARAAETTRVVGGLGFQCVSVSDSEEILPVLLSRPPEVILMNLDGLPSSGNDLATIIRQVNDDLARIPIIFISEDRVDGDELLSIRSRGDDLLYRPFDEKLLAGSLTARASRMNTLNALIKQRRLSDQRFRAITRNTRYAFVTTDAQGLIMSWNHGAEQMFGHAATDMLGTSISGIVPESLKDAVVPGELWSTIHNGGQRALALKGVTRDGAVFPMEISVSRWVSDGREFFGAIISDISARANAEEALEQVRLELKEKTQILEMTLDAIDQGFAVWGADQKLRAWSRLCQEFWYDPPPDVTAREAPMMNLLKHLAKRGAFGEGDTDELAVREHERIVELGRESVEDITLLDGRIINLHRFPTPDGGRVTKYTDVTRLHQAEAKLLASKEESEKANRAKSEFLSLMSHELRTPLNAILGFGQLLMAQEENDNLDENQREAANQIVASGKHLLSLIEEILVLSQIEIGKLELYLESVDIDDVLSDCLSMVKAAGRDRQIVFHAPATYDMLPRLWADQTRVKQIVLNLLTNAVKYNAEGGSVTVECEVKPHGMVRISVADTGKGIPKDLYDEVFAPFTRGAHKNSSIEGTGVGLSISKELAELMGGRIGFESEVGVGSTFWVELPTDRHGREPARPEEEETTQRAAIADIDGAIVLYVEDNAANQQLMRMIFDQLSGYHLSIADTGVRGIEMAREISPALIMLDINLPDMSGIDVLENLRRLDALSGTPIIGISAAAMQKDIDLANEVGFDAYITKPFNIKEMIELVMAYAPPRETAASGTAKT